MLYEALDLFQGCYQHYHNNKAAPNSFVDIEKHNRSVLKRTNKIIKDIIVEEDEPLVTDDDDEGEADDADAEEEEHDVDADDDDEDKRHCDADDIVGDDRLDIGNGNRVNHDENYNLSVHQADIVVRDSVTEGGSGINNCNNNSNINEDRMNLVGATINRQIDGDCDSIALLSDTVPISSKADLYKRRLLLKMELLNEKSALMRHHNHHQKQQQHHSQHQQEQQRRRQNRRYQTQSFRANNEINFASNYEGYCRNKVEAAYDCEKRSPSKSDFTGEYPGVMKVFSVSECVQ